MLQAQPYRKGKQRPRSLALEAMLRGRDAQGRNPADITRGTQRLMSAAKRPRRPARAKRPVRPQR
jgi:hypothetical protein